MVIAAMKLKDAYSLEKKPTEPVRMCANSLQLGLTLCDPLDPSLPSSSDQGILQARG